MKIIYVAGPFRGPTPWDIAENIRAAERIGLMVAMADAMPLIPHANTAHFDRQRDGQFWLDGTMELLRRCDGVVFLPTWRRSEGSVGEFREAGRLNIPRLCLDTCLPEDFSSEIAGFLSWVNRGQVNHTEEQRKAGQTVANGAR
jgi:hypothetical protein